MKTNKIIVVTEEYSCVIPFDDCWDFPKEQLIDVVQKSMAFRNEKVLDIADGNTHHICEYCGEIAKGTDGDVLCDECREIFGHTFYSEL